VYAFRWGRRREDTDNVTIDLRTHHGEKTAPVGQVCGMLDPVVTEEAPQCTSVDRGRRAAGREQKGELVLIPPGITQTVEQLHCRLRTFGRNQITGMWCSSEMLPKSHLPFYIPTAQQFARQLFLAQPLQVVLD